MKNVRDWVMATAVGAMAACALGSLKSPQALVIVQNGSMEEGTGDRPAAWEPRADTSHLQATWSTDRPHAGKRCLMLEGDQDVTAPWCWWRQDISLHKGEKYRLTAWVRSEAMTQDATILLKFEDAAGKQIATRQVAFPKETHGQWEQVNLTVKTPAAADKTTLAFSIHGKGKAWLDDLLLVSQAGDGAQSMRIDDSTLYPLKLTADPIDVNADAAAWETAPKIQLRKDPNSKGADLGVNFSLQADDKTLGLRLQVQDGKDRFVSRMPFWKGDSIQLALDTTYARHTAYGEGDYALAVSFTKDQPRLRIEHIPDGVSFPADDIKMTARHGPKGYVFQMAIPWQALGMKAPKANDRIGFDIAVNDSDGLNRQFSEWTSGVTSGKNPSGFGTIIITDAQGLADAISLSGSASDLLPVTLDGQVAWLGDSPRQIRPRVRITGNGEPLTDEGATFTLRPGSVTALPLTYDPGQIGSGVREATLTVDELQSHTTFKVQADAEAQADTMKRLDDIRQKVETLGGLVNQGKQQKLDVAMPDATLTTGQYFSKWIELDAHRRNNQALALTEAQRLEPLLDRAIGEMREVIANPGAHPEVPLPDPLRATLKDGNWYVDGRPMFFFGLMMYTPDVLADLPRLSCNFIDFLHPALDPRLVMPTGPAINTSNLLEQKQFAERAADLGMASFQRLQPRLPTWALRKDPAMRATTGHFIGFDISNPQACDLIHQTLTAGAKALRGTRGLKGYDFWNEAAYFDMSPQALSDFRQAMQQKYGDIQKLNQAWNKNYPSFDAIMPNTGNVAFKASYYDWVIWNQDRTTRYIDMMNKAVLAEDPAALTTVKIMNEHTVAGSLDLNLKQQERSQYDDGINRVQLAKILSVQGCDTRPTLEALSKKYALEWQYTGMSYDLQRSMAPQKPIYESEWHGIQTGAFHVMDIPPNFINASLWYCYLHGVDMNVTWWWSRVTGGFPYADNWFGGSMGAQPQVMDQWARTNIQVQRLAPKIIAFQDDQPRIRLLYSQPSAILDINYLNALRHSYEGLSWFGRPVGFVTEQMLTDGFDKLDLLVIPAAKYTSPGVREAIARLAQKGVTVVLIGNECLSCTPHGEKIVEPAAIDAVREADTPDEATWLQLLSKAKIEMGVRCVGADGKTSDPVAFQWVKQPDGQCLAYLIGLGSKPTKVTIEKDGHPVSYESILSGKVYNGAREIEPFDVDLIRLK